MSQVHLFRDDTRMLQTGLAKYFNNPLFSDVVVVPPDGRRLHCHQLVLATGSARFARMLEAGELGWGCSVLKQLCSVRLPLAAAATRPILATSHNIAAPAYMPDLAGVIGSMLYCHLDAAVGSP